MDVCVAQFTNSHIEVVLVVSLFLKCAILNSYFFQIMVWYGIFLMTNQNTKIVCHPDLLTFLGYKILVQFEDAFDDYNNNVKISKKEGVFALGN